jgi:hypothetical protein
LERKEMTMRSIDGLDRISWAVWDTRLGIVADVTRLSARRWHVEDYYSGVCATFKTRSQAFHYAMLLPEN